MVTTTYVRFRPVRPLDNAHGDPIRLAKARWSQELENNPNAIRYDFTPPPSGPIEERRESRVRDDVRWVDVTIDWTDVAAATGLFGNNSLFEFLCGYVAGAPSVVIEGREQHIEL